VQITHSDETGLVQITLSQPPEAKAGARKTLVALIAILGGLTAFFAIMGIAPPVMVFAWILIGVTITMLASYDRAARAYVFRAGKDAIVVASSGPFGPRYWECPRQQVRDVRIMTRRKHLLVFDLATPRSHRRRMFMLDLPREKLIEVADAVREGLGMAGMPGMPPRSEWI
jgi:hypothetical protein